MWPVAAIAFALDGILIGAGDTAFLALAMAISFVLFAPIVLAASTVAVVWIAIDVLMLTRVATLGARFARRRWALVGAHA
jgi:Na+-driven multidrug efflux pump